MKLEVALKIKQEVEKQWNTRFLTIAKYSQWVANIVLVSKKDGKVRICVDYKDLNKANPKDNFSLPHIDMQVDNTALHAFFSFMDDFFGYNQIQMVLEDKEKIFITTWGTFYYKVMPFRLKNARVTYQRAMVALFHNMMHNEIEVYVDDMIAKSKTSDNMWRTYETPSQKLEDGVESRLLKGLQKNQKIFGKPSRPCSGVTREALDTIFNNIGRIHGVCLGIARCHRKQRTSHLLSQQEVHRLRKKIPSARENLLCFGLGGKKAEAIYVGQHYMANIQDRPHQTSTLTKPEAYEWMMWFDEASNVLGNGIEAVLASPQDQCFPFSARLGFDCTNNMAKYKACAMGIMMALEHQVKKLKVFGDSALVIYHLHGEWETRDTKLVPYYNHVKEMIKLFDKITFHHIPREANQMVDALETLLAMV
ncbi:hypothetical protein CR513_06518, partial [Mucuna pruriens]